MASARWARSPTAWAIRASRTSATSSSGSSGRRQVPIAASPGVGSLWIGFEAGALRLRHSTKGQKTLFCGFVIRRKGKKLFFVASSLDERAKISFLWLRHSTKGQKSFFRGFVGRRRSKKHFSVTSSVDERAKNTFPRFRRLTKPFPEACKFLP